MYIFMLRNSVSKLSTYSYCAKIKNGGTMAHSSPASFCHALTYRMISSFSSTAEIHFRNNIKCSSEAPFP